MTTAPPPAVEKRRGVLRGGSGPPLVLIHAGWTSCRLWLPVFGQLAAKRDVLAPTMLGHRGGPPWTGGPLSLDDAVDGVERELDLAGFERPDVVGNSVGGVVALELARRGRARRVVAISPMGMQTAAQARAIERRATLGRRAARAARRAALPALAVPQVRRLLLRDMAAHGERIPTRLARHLVYAFTWFDVPGVMDAVRGADGAMPQIEHPEQITEPVLLIWGDHDTIATRDQMDRYRAALPNVHYLEIDDAGHCPQLDEPERIASEILTFTD